MRAGDAAARALQAVPRVLQYISMMASQLLQDGMAHILKMQLLLSQIPPPGATRQLSDDSIRDLLRALNAMPKLRETLADTIPALANFEGASTQVGTEGDLVGGSIG